MPSYNRKCEGCGRVEGVVERMDDVEAKECECGGKMWRLIADHQPPRGGFTPIHHRRGT